MLPRADVIGLPHLRDVTSCGCAWRVLLRVGVSCGLRVTSCGCARSRSFPGWRVMGLLTSCGCALRVLLRSDGWRVRVTSCGYARVLLEAAGTWSCSPVVVAHAEPPLDVRSARVRSPVVVRHSCLSSHRGAVGDRDHQLWLSIAISGRRVGVAKFLHQLWLRMPVLLRLDRDDGAGSPVVVAHGHLLGRVGVDVLGSPVVVAHVCPPSCGWGLVVRFTSCGYAWRVPPRLVGARRRASERFRSYGGQSNYGRASVPRGSPTQVVRTERGTMLHTGASLRRLSHAGAVHSAYLTDPEGGRYGLSLRAASL
jgi:hypothetical protein